MFIADAPPPPPTMQEVFWAMPDGGTSDNVTWPQTYLANPTQLECGISYQVDLYNVDDIPALTADGILTNGEDHGVVISWRFVQGPVCEVIPPVEPPVVVVPPVEVVTPPIEVVTPPIETVATVTPVTPAPQLAETGINGWATALLATALLTAGTTLQLTTRRRKEGKS